MIYVNTALSQHHTPASLPLAVRAALGKPLRRAAPLTQLALIGALACLPAERRHLPTVLLWQTTSGPRQETLALLDEVCNGPAEPMPYDFLATQSAIAAAQIQPFLPGLRSATHFPLDTPDTAQWAMLLGLASNWLNEGRYAQVLCAHLDTWPETAEGHWLCLSHEPLEGSLASLQIAREALIYSSPRRRPGSSALNFLDSGFRRNDESGTNQRLLREPLADTRPDTPDFPLHLAGWLEQSANPALHLLSPTAPRLAVEFARL